MNAYDILGLEPGTLQAQFTTLTPETAQLLLDTQDLADVPVANRNLRSSRVNIWAEAMVGGFWMMNGESVVFDTDGHLIDGQHRLTALASLSGLDIDVDFLLVLGVARSAQDTMDQGMLRQISGKLSMRGYSMTNTIAAVVRHLYLAEKNGDFAATRTQSSSDTMALAYLTDNEDEVLHGMTYNETGKKLTRSSSLFVVAYIKLARISREDADEFFLKLRSGAGMEEGNPILTLREKLLEMKSDKQRGLDANYKRDQLAFMYLAWNAFREGRQVRMLRRPNGGVWTEENFPQPR